MVIRKIIFILGLSVSFSCMAVPPQPTNSTTTAPQTPPPTSSPTTDNAKENQQDTDKKSSMAEYCKEHTC